VAQSRAEQKLLRRTKIAEILDGETTNVNLEDVFTNRHVDLAAERTK
jgi:hypothetical protein